MSSISTITNNNVNGLGFQFRNTGYTTSVEHGATNNTAAQQERLADAQADYDAMGRAAQIRGAPGVNIDFTG